MVLLSSTTAILFTSQFLVSSVYFAHNEQMLAFRRVKRQCPLVWGSALTHDSHRAVGHSGGRLIGEFLGDGRTAAAGWSRCPTGSPSW